MNNDFVSNNTINPLLSVIIISYNEEQFLQNAIESCLAQTRDFSIEIIIGDDGSSDGSLKIIKDYSKKYDFISYFVQDRSNIGKYVIPSYRVTDVIKKGLNKAKGKYIQILSGDDFFTSKEKFSKSIDFLEANKKYSSYITHFQKYYSDEHIEEIPYKKLSKKIYWAVSYIHISCFIFRNSNILKNNLLLHFCDDTGLEYSLLQDGKWKFSKDVMFSYRQREQSIMSSANHLELHLLELMVYEDIERNQKKYFFQTKCRYIPSFKYVMQHRKELDNGSFEKYLSSDLNRYIKVCIDFDKEGVFLKMLFKLKISLYTAFCFYYKVIRKIFC